MWFFYSFSPPKSSTYACSCPHMILPPRISSALIWLSWWYFVRSMEHEDSRVISGFRREVDDICAFLGYYTASSGNFLPTFRYNLSVPSSGVKNPKPTRALFIKLLVTHYPLPSLTAPSSTQARCSRTPSTCEPFLVVSYHVLHANKITGKLIFLHILIFIFLGKGKGRP